MEGRVFLRRSSSLTGKRWQQDAAFARSRAAAASFGDVAASVGYWYRRLPEQLRRLMDAGAYNRIVGAAVRAAGPVGTRDGSIEGLGFLRGMDLSWGQPGWAPDTVGLVGMDAEGTVHTGVDAMGGMKGCVRVGVAGLEALMGKLPGMEVRVRLLGCRVSVEETGRLHDRGMQPPRQMPFRRDFETDWVSCTDVREDDVVWLDMGEMASELAGRRYVGVIGVEVAVRPSQAAPCARSRRWRRLPSACKVWVVEAGVVPTPAGIAVHDDAFQDKGTSPGAVCGDISLGQACSVVETMVMWRSSG